MTGPLHIAHVLPWPAVGGVEVGTLRVAQAVEGDDFRGVAYCLQDALPVRKLFEGSGIPVATYTAAPHSYRHPSAYWRASRSLAQDLRRRRIDVIHCADLLAGYYAVLAGKLAGIPVLCHVRCIFDRISLRDQSFLWGIDRFAFVSENVRQQFAYRSGARSGSVIYDGIPIPNPPHDVDTVRAEFGISPSAPLIGMVARIAPAKDYPTLIQAAAIVLRATPEARFLIVGDYSSAREYREHYEKVQTWLKEAGIGSSFIFTGHRQDVTRLNAAMDVCVLSTHGEGVPLALLEAMALGKPVVATGVGGILDLIQDRENGLLHRHGDGEHLAAMLLSLLQNPDRAKALGERALEDVRTRFSCRANAAELAKLYRKLARRPPHRDAT